MRFFSKWINTFEFLYTLKLKLYLNKPFKIGEKFDEFTENLPNILHNKFKFLRILLPGFRYFPAKI